MTVPDSAAVSARSDEGDSSPVLVIRSRRLVCPEGVRAGSVHIEGQQVSQVADYDAVHAAGELLDVGDLAVSPGLVDTHVHINEPGRTEWEGFETATRAAAAGGVTTLVDMPLNSIPATTSREALALKRQAARRR